MTPSRAAQATHGEFIPLSGRILIHESSGRWTRKLRQRTQAGGHLWSGITVQRVLDLSDLVWELTTPPMLNGEAYPSLPAAVLAETTHANLVATSAQLATLIEPGSRAIWLAGDRLTSLSILRLQQLGFVDYLEGLMQFEQCWSGLVRFFQSAPPVEWPLELRIEHQYPWRPAVPPPNERSE